MIQTLHLFRPLNQELMERLRSLGPADWSRSTVAGSWTIKDVASHLLDGNLRAIALYRDSWQLPPEAISNYNQLVSYLNRLNADWVTATRRLSPSILVEWLETTHEPFIRCFEQLDPTAPAIYSVAWAGESVSTNAFHIAREYTEKWHHQQQIQEAFSSERIMTRTFYHPVLDTFLQALPYTYQHIPSPEGTRVCVLITGEAGGTWVIEKQVQGWRLVGGSNTSADAEVKIPASIAWKLFTKAVSPEQVQSHITLSGKEEIARPVLGMLSVMALR